MANTYVHRGVRQCKTCRRANCRKSYAANRDERVAKHAAWRATRRPQLAAATRRWAQENREQANLISRIKKHRRRSAGTLTTADWMRVLVAYGDRCLACNAQPVTIDHIVPTSRGGANAVDNVQPLCSTCNTSKGTKTIDYRPEVAVAHEGTSI